MQPSQSILEQLDWLHKEIEAKQKTLMKQRLEVAALESSIDNMERDRSRLFRLALNLSTSPPPLPSDIPAALEKAASICELPAQEWTGGEVRPPSPMHAILIRGLIKDYVR